MTDADQALADAQLSREVARQAGQLLLELRMGASVDPEDRAAADRLRKEADRTSHEFILEALTAARPQDAVLSEEGKDDPRRLDAARVWIVDPLDGTWEFGQGRSDFAVHIALWSGGRLSACTVDLPAQGLTRSVLDEPSLPGLPQDRPLRVVASRTRPPATLAATTEALGRILREQGIATRGVEIVDVGSVGAKVNELLSGRAEAYVHDTGFYEWDVAAPLGVAQHYGLAAAHIDGSSVVCNLMPPYVPSLRVAHPAIAPALELALAEAAAL